MLDAGLKKVITLAHVSPQERPSLLPRHGACATRVTAPLEVLGYTTQRYSKPKVFGQRYSKTKGIRVPKVFENEKSVFAKPVRRIYVIHVYLTIYSSKL